MMPMPTPRITDAGRWMPTKPTATLQAVVLALAATVLATVAMVLYQWTPLQRLYVSGYLKSAVTRRLNLPAQTYEQVLLQTKAHQYFATTADVALDAEGRLVPTPTAVLDGATGVSRRTSRVDNAEMQRLLRTHIYGGHGLLWYGRLPLLVGLLILGALLCWSVPTDVHRARARRHGAHLRGSELVAVTEFNRRIREA